MFTKLKVESNNDNFNGDWKFTEVWQASQGYEKLMFIKLTKTSDIANDNVYELRLSEVVFGS